MPLFVIIRHGQSQWNLENRFTGSADPPLTDLGREEAREAGALLKASQSSEKLFSMGFTSELQRTIETMDIILREMGQPDLPIERSAALNERKYGDLQGLNKAEAEERFGVEQLFRWRRGYEDRPTNGESLSDIYELVVHYYETTILPHLQNGQSILVVGHGNNLRALLMHLEQVSAKSIEDVELATGIPRQYEYDQATGTFALLPK
ncbi:2,3-bisphosphoglycerate-dependent phosphoglycerate mutase [Spirosoma validum]|uniref:2,3-bisphosphoglycerate-dependent phosphoglycerate mutase n=1 Tax=Spirosoma validum TaxID=2771355 RepID=A0A927GDF3_9BACT|nr:2,3-bisphosphoglycerate-dependent phosphoglycerate mutase [Spirosoma validum]MBD2753505.1 2,3-bisphosphoglycerate-dependent phosphoglycerate mutase [Spirosoma validum]